MQWGIPRRVPALQTWSFFLAELQTKRQQRRQKSAGEGAMLKPSPPGPGVLRPCWRERRRSLLRPLPEASPPFSSSLSSLQLQQQKRRKGAFRRGQGQVTERSKGGETHHFVPSSIVMISSSSVTSLGIRAAPLTMADEASYRSSARTISCGTQESTSNRDPMKKAPAR